MPLANADHLLWRALGGEDFRECDFIDAAAARELPGLFRAADFVLEDLTAGEDARARRGARRLCIGAAEVQPGVGQLLQVWHVGQLGIGIQIVERAAIRAPVIDDHQQDVGVDGIGLRAAAAIAVGGFHGVVAGSASVQQDVEFNLAAHGACQVGSGQVDRLAAESQGGDLLGIVRCTVEADVEGDRFVNRADDTVLVVEASIVEVSDCAAGDLVETLVWARAAGGVRGAHRIAVSKHLGIEWGEVVSEVRCLADLIAAAFDCAPGECDLIRFGIINTDGFDLFDLLRTAFEMGDECGGEVVVFRHGTDGAAGGIAEVGRRDVVWVNWGAIGCDAGEIGPGARWKIGGDAPAHVVFVEVEVDVVCHTEVSFVVVVLHIATDWEAAIDWRTGDEAAAFVGVDAVGPCRPTRAGVVRAELVAGDHPAHGAVGIKRIAVAIRAIHG